MLAAVAANGDTSKDKEEPLLERLRTDEME